jgi:hypothetical protein
MPSARPPNFVVEFSITRHRRSMVSAALNITSMLPVTLLAASCAEDIRERLPAAAYAARRDAELICDSLHAEMTDRVAALAI